ncbi:MAG: sugar transferase [Mangrovicoccus sp.]
MTWSKRLFDIGLALFLAFFLWPFAVLAMVAILLIDGAPILYVSERMRSPDRAFRLWKFRTMRPRPSRSGVTGGDKSAEITRTGSILRRTRFDELPQLWNILRGDMSFVGPRPPLRRYVELRPELYAQVLIMRPGLTGMATAFFRRHEEAILARCKTAEQTHMAYLTSCVPRKAKLDMIYRDKWRFCLDIWLVLVTVKQIITRT